MLCASMSRLEIATESVKQSSAADTGVEVMVRHWHKLEIVLASSWLLKGSEQ
jgi:hypothetical protein